MPTGVVALQTQLHQILKGVYHGALHRELGRAWTSLSGAAGLVAQVMTRLLVALLAQLIRE